MYKVGRRSSQLRVKQSHSDRISGARGFYHSVQDTSIR